MTTKKFIAVVASLATASMMFAAVAVPAPAQAQTTAELQNQISLLLAQISALQAQIGGGVTTTPASTLFTRDLTIGATGADVTALQNFLISRGHAIPAGATGYFGAQTKAALAAYQAANGIMPAAGYFGPITRAQVNSTGTPTTPTTPSTPGDVDGGSSSDLEGGAGSITDTELISSLNNEEVGEGEEDVEVAGLEIEADNASDIELVAIRLNFDQSADDADDGSDNDHEDFDRYADEVSIWFDGEEVARVDADEFEDDDSFARTISLDSGAIIRGGDTGEITVAISGVSNLDSGNEQDVWSVDFETVRFRDAQGAVISETVTEEAREFSFESFSTAADLELVVSKGDKSINDSQVIKIDDTDDTNGVEIFSFNLEAEGDSDIEIKDLPILFTVGTAGISQVINSAELFIDGESVASENITDTGTTTVFDNIDYVIDAGDTVEVTLEVDFNQQTGNYADGETLRVEIGSTERNAIEAEDEEGNDLTSSELSGTASSDDHTLSLTDVTLTDVSSDVNRLANDDTAGSITWEFTLGSDEGDIDFNIANKNDVNGSSDDVRFTVTGTDPSIGNTTITLISGDATSDGSGWMIDEGDEATFILETTFDTVDVGDNGTYRVRLESVESVEVDQTSSGLILAHS